MALLTDGPLKGKPVEVEPVEGRPPMTIDLQAEDDGTLRYCLVELNQDGDHSGLHLPLRRLSDHGRLGSPGKARQGALRCCEPRH